MSAQGVDACRDMLDDNSKREAQSSMSLLVIDRDSVGQACHVHVVKELGHKRGPIVQVRLRSRQHPVSASVHRWPCSRDAQEPVPCCPCSGSVRVVCLLLAEVEWQG